MTMTKISRGGQISVPAAVRRRWGTDRLLIEDRGDSLLLRPLPDDPIAAALGSLKTPGAPSESVRAAMRRADARAERRRSGR